MKVVEQFKRRILDLAIRGKLVPQDPNDEPASVLLERIKAEKAKLVKAGKIKKEKNPSEIVIGSDGAAYEKFGDGDSFNTEAQRRRVDVPFDLPQGWAWCRWKNISLSIQYGYNAPALPKGRIQMVRISDIQEGRIQWEKVPYCGIQESDIGKYLLAPGDILFARTGGTVGKSYLVDDIPHESIYAGYLVRTKSSSMVFPKYTKAFLESNCYWQQLRSGVIATAQPNFNGEKLASMLVPLPPLTEQRRIVAKIEELFAVVDSLGEAADNLESDAKRLDKKILDLAIRGKLVPQDPNYEPASELVKRIAASHKSPCKNQGKPIDPPFEIPDSWEWVRLKELGVFCGGHTPSTSNPKLWGGDILWVSSKDMKSKYIDDTQIKVTRLGAEELNVLKPGALLMCTRSGILRRVFPVAIARRELTINQDQRALTLWLPEMIEYVYLALKSLESIILSDYKKSGTTVESIIWNKFVDLPIPLPPLNEQKRIVKRVEELKATTRTLVTF